VSAGKERTAATWRDASAALQRTLLGALPAHHPDPELDRFYALMREYPSRGGKHLRGRTVLLATAAHGGDPTAALPVAAALELFQNWVLVHDDIEDASEERRGRPALHRLVGVPVALNVGDAMHVYMWALLLGLANRPGFDADAVRREFTWMIHRTAEGQHLDLTWVAQGRLRVSEDEYLQMVHLKTSAYTVTSPLRLGAYASGREPHPALARIGERLGAAFQIRDDVLNLTPPQAAGGYGKEFAGDLLEGKRTLILVHLLAQAPSDTVAEVERRLAAPRGERTADDVAYLLGRIEAHGSLRYAQGVAERLAGSALEELRDVLADAPGAEAVTELTQLLESLTRRAE
jgi:geranylgeranyl diphosphate synthase, type II